MWPAAERYLKACDVRLHDGDRHTSSLANSHYSCQSDRWWSCVETKGCSGWWC